MSRTDRKNYLIETSENNMTESSYTSHMIDQELERLPPEVVNEYQRVTPLVPGSMHRCLLVLAEKLVPLSCSAAIEFLKTCPFIVTRVDISGLESWFNHGLDVLRKSEESGIAYFRLEMNKSTQLLERLSSGIELTDIKRLLEAYCLALTGYMTPVLPISTYWNQSLDYPLPEQPSADGLSIFLPDFIGRNTSKLENFTLYKVMVNHQAGHIEFGSYDFHFDGPANFFNNSRQRFSRKAQGDGSQTDLQRYLGLFDDRKLATDIFTIVEDGRIDYLVKYFYRGISQNYSRIQNEALSIRPPLTSYPLKEVALEVLLQLSLGLSGELLVPCELSTPLYLVDTIMRRILSPDANVEDSAEATVRLYRILFQLPNDPVTADHWEIIDFSNNPYISSTTSLADIDHILKNIRYKDNKASSYTSPKSVEFRGPFILERASLPGKSEQDYQDGINGEYPPSSQQTTTAPVGQDNELEIVELTPVHDNSTEGSLVCEVDKAKQDNILVIIGQRRRSGADDSEIGALEVDSPFSYLYDEWDFRVGDYRSNWCRVRQRLLDEGTLDFFDTTLNEYAGTITQIRRQFELLNPQFFRKVKRLRDGEDFDLDAVVDSIVNKKAGQSPDEKVYWRRNKTERDISVAFLLDMSSSTIEYIDKKQRESLGLSFVRDYKGYLEWLQTNYDNKPRPMAFKRIIDLEKESIVLLIKALETIGDTYAIYGFSGYGRQDVEFYVIKELGEEFSDRIKRRIDTITPKHGTRMGPAVRHATWKLKEQESRSKFLFLISDGRPEDHAYGKDGLEREYAVNDTKMALMEAKQGGIIPFCLTVDRQGQDYLRTIRGDMRYEVIADIESLPKCLPALYSRFTT